MDDSILTDNLHFSRTATNQPSNSLNTKNSTLHRVLTSLCLIIITNCTSRSTYTSWRFMNHH